MSARARCSSGLLWFLIVCQSAAAGSPSRPPTEAVLPPLAPWDGASRRLALGPDEPWATPFESSGLVDSPRYAETVAWLERVAAAAPEIELVTIGESHERRPIVMVVAAADGARTPEALQAAGRPVVLVQAGIHSGEIDGKDAGMMLLRDMTVRGTRRELLEHVSLLFIPILSVDAHERSSAHGRINQRGPRETGWRTNSRNQNLNRDYTKLETPEIRAVVRVMREWRPDLYIDVHVTDGIDWQYDVTWGAVGGQPHSPASDRWIAERLDPALGEALERQGHVPGPLVFPVDGRDLSRGVVVWRADPRYSNGYGDARRLPTVLVENHSLKPFDRRVLGTYVLLEAALRAVGADRDGLRRAIAADRSRRPERIPLAWGVPSDAEPEIRSLAAIGQVLTPSAVSGALRVEYTGKPVTLDVPWLVMSEAKAEVAAPRAYWIPPSRPDVIDVLEQHGIVIERIDEPAEVAVEMYRLTEVTFDAAPFEGHFRVTAKPVPERREESWPAGSARVTLDQPLGVLAALMLEPASPDSLFQWGLFHDVLQRTEYAEGYVMEPTAQRMLAADPQLARQFRARLMADPAFAANPEARLGWFYERTPYHDERHNLYPIGREVGEPPAR